ncbi:hypothetical protein EZ428_20170 [Pedobacter frigiditerrae]|uniref:Lipoprotein n=1 Tax=Pedobacter frigiditerrae TaxID=2530452 RepID=A0A4R0MMS0_9SPHI|nr:hypothetical protein [Pedobacter frigiditerrae]TCC88041.1 hypothetical protein EZ428_20170 [Pedobacter frigiditerrae]
MKMKNPYIAIVAMFMLSIGIYSCRKEVASLPEMKPEAQWAKSYFNDVLLPNAGNQVSYAVSNKVSSTERTGKKTNLKTPIWTRASVDKTALYEFVEIPLAYTHKITSIIGKKNEKPDLEIIKASFDRLLIFKDKKGKINQRIISFIPDKDYLNRHNGDISHNKINKLDKDFNGFLIYKTWNNVTVNKLRITNGKAASLSKSNVSKPYLKVNKLASIDRTTSDRAGYEGEPGCADWYHFEYEIWCEYVGDNPVPTSCGEPILVSETYLYTICPDDPPGGGEGGCEDPANFNNPECQNGGGEGGVDPEEEDWGQFGTFNYTDETIVSGEDDNSETITRYVTAFISKPAEFLWFQTKEKVTLTKYLPFMGYWELQGITHDSMGTVGNQPSDMTISVIDVATTGSLHQTTGTPLERYTNDYVQMNYTFNEKRTKIINGQPVEKIKENITGVKTWNAIHCRPPQN